VLADQSQHGQTVYFAFPFFEILQLHARTAPLTGRLGLIFKGQGNKKVPAFLFPSGLTVQERKAR
jgi:hypothetical protein